MIHRILRKQYMSRDCFICGINNDSGLKASFYEVEGDELVCTFKTKEIHQSYPGRTHGGIIAGLLDEAIGRAINIYERDTFGVTINLNVTYRKPVPYNEELKVIGKVTNNKARMFEAEGKIVNLKGEVLAEAKATYAKLPTSQIVKGISQEEIDKLMFEYIQDDDIKEIDY